ncbi:TusE/DsrC/DsvC family sulfur relay protein [Shewanella sp. 202IG2-18]|nr:TusE/DsrC/DsvC family sulfur relay protein [Parashewanella hymeniacidonis]
MSRIIYNDQQIETDKQGYLLDFKLWNKDIAQLIAEADKVELTDAHWEVINFVREFYLEYKTSPAIRALVKAIKLSMGEEKGNSKYLYKLFPEGPAKQATKIAGLPKPARCI